jgi:hypothetical protein
MIGIRINCHSSGKTSVIYKKDYGSTADHIFCICQVQERNSGTLHELFVDFKEAVIQFEEKYCTTHLSNLVYP